MNFYCLGCGETLTEEESVIHYSITEDKYGNPIQVQCGPLEEIIEE